MDKQKADRVLEQIDLCKHIAYHNASFVRKKGSNELEIIMDDTIIYYYVISTLLSVANVMGCYLRIGIKEKDLVVRFGDEINEESRF